ncbi:MAG TPA: hypothetical protein VMU87_09895 [Stellaceae bacterium]|nr:hypothetical protein [Stellaceae bacterium]
MRPLTASQRFLTALAFGLLPVPAEAHIKWFAPYSVPEQPRLLSAVFSRGFLLLTLTALVVLTIVCWLERTAVGQVLARSFDRLGAGIRARTEEFYRAGTGAFFVALFTLGNIILTPELLTKVDAVSWLQAAIALGMVWRTTMVLSAAGIVALYAYGVLTYGIFHLLDYPIFLALAAYLALTAARVRIHDFRPIDVARWGAAVTLMWASIEKWAYPQWTYPVLQSHHSLTFGFSPPFYMTAAGFVEFSLGFSLLWTPLVRGMAATVLSAMFTSAVLEFGKIDAIGHLMIVVTLVTVGADNGRVVRRTTLAPVFYCAALATTLAFYYGLHALIYGTRIW